MQKNLKGFRQFAGYTTEELGREVDVSKQSICNWENGNGGMQFPTYIALRRILEMIAYHDNNRVLSAAMNRAFSAEYDESGSKDVVAANILAISILMKNCPDTNINDSFITSVLGEIPEKVEWDDCPCWLKELI